ncbi:MAG: hypothetical protein ABI321_13885 [Polyangia bacterium]
MTARPLVTLSALLLAGCLGHADVLITHPLIAKTPSAETEVEKPMSFVESGNGLPDGSMTQRARLTKLDEKNACFAVKLHSLRAELSDVRQLTAILKDKPSNRTIEGARIMGGRRSEHTYTGLVEEQQEAGSETYCASRDANQVCQSWRTRTLYTTRMVPGPVTVYESTAELCFENDGLVTAKSQRVILDLHKIEMVGFMPARVAGMDFRWGFTGGGGAKASKED